MNDTGKTLLSIKNLNVQYSCDESVVHAANNVYLDVLEGETLGLVGETGAGKTTIALSLLRLIPNPPGKIAAGEIYFKGKDILKLSENEMKKIRGNQISMIFQDPMTALNPVLTIGSQVAETIMIHEKVSRREAEKKAIQTLEMVGISSDRFDEYPHQFSGGMKQRVVIAIALACNPELLIADEPTTALDVTIQAQILEMMNNLKKNLNTSMIMITHDLGIVAQTCERVAVVYAGEIVEVGKARDIYKNTSHPYTIGLFNSLPSLENADEHDLDKKRLKPIEGLMPDPTDLPAGCKFAPRCPKRIHECENPVDFTEISEGHKVRCVLFKGGRT